MHCEVCGGKAADSRLHTATERMFGLGGQFRYMECAQCGCLSLLDVPDDLGPYYPPDYYAFGAGPRPGRSPGPRWLRRWLMGTFLDRPSLARLGIAVRSRLGGGSQAWTLALSGIGLTTGAAILDVGCGSGRRLEHLGQVGFENLTGTDAFLPDHGGHDGRDGRANLVPHDLDALSGSFDLIMCHHSFEHMADPVGVLRSLDRLLSPRGAVLLRVPLAGSWAWRTYGVDWVQLDAPRHLFLFTPEGVELLAARSGFVVTRVIYDSDALQFWGSEQYRQGAPLRDPRAPGEEAPRFTAGQLRRFRRRARELNALGDGDQAVFLLRKDASAEPGPAAAAPVKLRTGG